MGRVKVDCWSWDVELRLVRYGLADISIVIPLHGDEDPRTRFIADTTRYAGAVDPKELEEAVAIYKKLYKDRDAKQLIETLGRTIAKWLAENFECVTDQEKN